MNVLFLSTENPYPPNHGHHIRTYNTLKYIAKRHDVYFLSFIKKVEDSDHIEPIKKICKSADFFIIPDDISKIRLIISLIINIFSTYPYVVQKYYRKEMLNKMHEINNTNKIDLIHYDMLHLSRYHDDFKNTPSILIEHNVESLRVKRLMENSKNYLFKFYMWLQYLKLFRFEKSSCSVFDYCAAVSENDKAILRKMNSDANIIVIPNGVETSYFKPSNTNIEPNSLVWVGLQDRFRRL